MADGAVLNPVYNSTDYSYTGTAYVDNNEYSISKTYNSSSGNYTDSYTYGKAYTPEGYVTTLSNPQYYYFRKDHLGNNREVWLANTNTTLQRTQYYPSGLPWAESTGQDEQNKKYNGKEFVEAHGYDTYDYGARGYYSAIGRFSTADPLMELHPNISPYAYCNNNPINYIDPTGMYSTQEWKDDNGVTDDDVITIYKSSKNQDDKNEKASNSENIILKELKRTILNYFGWNPELNPENPKDREIIDKASKHRVDAAKQINNATKVIVIGSCLYFIGAYASYAVDEYGGILLVRLTSEKIGESGVTVLGTFNAETGGYAGLAQGLGANYFQMPTWAWGTLKFLGNSEQWAANVRFLEASIARGDAFLLSTSAYLRSAGTSFYKEIEYLLSRGYTISSDGYSLIAP